MIKTLFSKFHLLTPSLTQPQVGAICPLTKLSDNLVPRSQRQVVEQTGVFRRGEKEVIFKIEEWLGVGDWVRMKYRFFQYLTKRSSRQLNQDDLKIVVGPIGYRPIPGIFSFSFSFFFSAGKRLLLQMPALPYSSLRVPSTHTFSESS